MSFKTEWPRKFSGIVDSLCRQHFYCRSWRDCLPVAPAVQGWPVQQQEGQRQRVGRQWPGEPRRPPGRWERVRQRQE
jgi:hypothetical protein